MRFRALVLGFVALGFVFTVPIAAVWAGEKVHVVYAGQRLGSIARRYNVTVEELCRRNGIRETAPIQPGQRLIIPDPDSKSSDARPVDAKASSSPPGAAPRAPSKPIEDPGAGARARVHVVTRGHTLTDISHRYGVSIAAICRASGLNRNEPLDVGQIVIVPDKADSDGEQARRLRLQGHFDQDRQKGDTPSRSYVRYLKKPWRRGYVSLFRYNLKWKGYVVGAGGELLGQASTRINWLLGAAEDGPRIDPRLIRLLAQVSDAFGGREVRIVSGYRTQSWVSASKHKQGAALDFSIPGVPNEALRDYLRTLPDVGVGYYPNSSFVHLDVRAGSAYWVDYAGPGEPPRKHP